VITLEKNDLAKYAGREVFVNKIPAVLELLFTVTTLYASGDNLCVLQKRKK